MNNDTCILANVPQQHVSQGISNKDLVIYFNPFRNLTSVTFFKNKKYI